MPLEIVPESEPAPEVDTRVKVEFMGDQFAIADKVGLMPLLKFARAAQSGLDSADAEGMAALLDMLEQCIADDEWKRFEAHATKTRADDEDLMQLIKNVMTQLSARPTSRPSASSDGPPSTATTSEESSSALAAVRRLNSGPHPRPDLGMAVLRTQVG
jgi:hypothetical protein